MNKKGFTLVELLAVIIILAIILVIAIPSITNVIENSKKTTLANNAKVVLKSLKLDYEAKSTNGTFTDTFILYDNSVKTTYPSTNNVDFSFSAKDGGIIVYKDGTTMMAVHDGTNCATKLRTSSDITVTETTKASCIANIYAKQATAPFSNLVTNGDFSSGTTGWTTSFTVDSTIDRVGTKSLKYTNNGSQTGSIEHSITGVNGNKYYTSAWVYLQSNTGGQNTAIYINNSNLAQSIGIGGAYGNPTLIGEWQRLSGVVTGYSGDAGFFFRMYSHLNVCTVNVDDIVIINLTSSYGAGSEPTATQMENNMNKVWIDSATNTPKKFIGGSWINF